MDQQAPNGIIELDSARGKQLGFTSDRFGFGSYLWDSPGRVTVSFIVSHAKGNFRLLVNAILAEGKEIAVPTPFPEMQRILTKNGYRHTVESDEEVGPVDVWVFGSGVSAGDEPRG